jgi:DNA-binding MarR family transcriptional regulator
MSEIGCKLSMPKPHVTNLVDKLIAEDMVERLLDPKDRRIVNIRITEKGIADFNAIKLEISQELRIRLEKLSAEKLDILAEASQQIKDILIEMELSYNGSSTCCK